MQAQSVATATRSVLAQVRSLPAEERPLLQALGTVLAAPVVAAQACPPFAASIKDGYAVRSVDGAGEYELTGASRAGQGAKAAPLSPRQAAYVTTGAPLPAGADAVVALEAARPAGVRRIVIDRPVPPGNEVRATGSDIAAGTTVLARGDRLGPAEVGLLASQGCCCVRVTRQPHVAVASTGDELVDPLVRREAVPPLGVSQIYDSNRPMLIAAAAAAGARATDLGVLRDTEAAIDSALDAALAAGADVLICSGGVSMGDRDLLRAALERRGALRFGRVLMKPGKPATFATVRRGAEAKAAPMLVFALPGNPVSALVCFELLVRPALRALRGESQPEARRVVCRTTSALDLDPERPEYHRAVIESRADGLHAHSTGRQISSRLLSCRAADALLELPQAAGTLPSGSVVSALLLGDIRERAPATADPLPALVPCPPPPPAARNATAEADGADDGAAPLAVGLLLVGGTAIAGAAPPALAAAAHALERGLAPGSWRAVRRRAHTLGAALRAMCSGSPTCGVVLVLGPPPSPPADPPARKVPPLSSVVRATSGLHAPAAALLGDCAVALLARSLVVHLPQQPDAAVACVRSLLPTIRSLAARDAGESVL